jgi:hypothetical protein
MRFERRQGSVDQLRDNNCPFPNARSTRLLGFGVIRLAMFSQSECNRLIATAESKLLLCQTVSVR